MKLTEILPPRFFQLALVALLLIHFLLPLYFLYDSPLRFLGLFPILTGIWLNLRTDWLFKKNKTTIKPFEDSSALIKTGPFRYSRNPVYLGMVLITLGGAIISGSILSLTIPATLAIILQKLYIRHEEQQLEQAFGEEFLQYSSEVHRWI